MNKMKSMPQEENRKIVAEIKEMIRQGNNMVAHVVALKNLEQVAANVIRNYELV